jgi:nucleoside-diphosphate-sugar epimerase
LTAYAKSKILVEQELMKLASDEFSPVMFRNATAFGVSPRMRFDIVLNNFAGHAWTSKIIKLKSDGSPERPMVHILDISQAFALALEMPRGVIHNQIINIGDTKQNYRVSEIAETISSVFPGCTVTYGKNDEDERSYRVSFKKISEVMPDFKCTMNLEAGAKEFKKLFEEIHLSQEDFEFPAFTRLKQLKLLLQTEKIDQSLYWRVQ